MKIVFMSDIHGVPSALEAALAKADSIGYDRLAATTGSVSLPKGGSARSIGYFDGTSLGHFTI